MTVAGTDRQTQATARGGVGQPSVLACTSELPWPLNSGGHLRTYHLLRALARQFRVRLVAPVCGDAAEALAALSAAGIEAHPAAVPPRSRWRETIRLGAAALRGEPYVFYRRHDRRAVRRALQALCQAEPPDVIYLDHLDSFVFRPLLPQVPAVIDLHNVYSALAARAAAEHRSPAARLYLRREARLLQKVEERAARGVNALMAVSEDDARFFAAWHAAGPRVVPNGVDCAAYRHLPVGRSGAPLILYVGAMSWEPNVAAAEFLCREALPAVRRRVTDACVRIVGREPPQRLRDAGQLPGVEIAGGVPDVVPHLAEARLLAVPLQAGGGTRLKILEAFAAGLPVVSTAVGCEGLGVVDGEHLVIAERDRFADAVADLLANVSRGQELAARGRVLVEERFDWGTVGQAACAAVAEALAGRRGKQ
jgi:glycosyltransferase involved in cell wall biosynthesis